MNLPNLSKLSQLDQMLLLASARKELKAAQDILSSKILGAQSIGTEVTTKAVVKMIKSDPDTIGERMRKEFVEAGSNYIQANDYLEALKHHIRQHSQFEHVKNETWLETNSAITQLVTHSGSNGIESFDLHNILYAYSQGLILPEQDDSINVLFKDGKYKTYRFIEEFKTLTEFGAAGDPRLRGLNQYGQEILNGLNRQTETKKCEWQEKQMLAPKSVIEARLNSGWQPEPKL